MLIDLSYRVVSDACVDRCLNLWGNMGLFIDVLHCISFCELFLVSILLFCSLIRTRTMAVAAMLAAGDVDAAIAACQGKTSCDNLILQFITTG